MGKVVPFSQKEIEELARLHSEGLGRNQIATRMGRSLRGVSVHAQRLGLTFDRTATEAATRAKVVDAKARRANIISGLYELAQDDLDYLRKTTPYDLVEVSAGKAVRYKAERLPAQDRRALIHGVSSAASAAARLEAMDTNNGVDDAKSMLGQLATGLTAAYHAMNEGAGDAP
jgi:hypothetical protein